MKISVTHVIQAMYYHRQRGYATHATPIAICVKRISYACIAIVPHYYKMVCVSVAQSDARRVHPQVFAPLAWLIITSFQTDVNLALQDVSPAHSFQDIHVLLARMGIF